VKRINVPVITVLIFALISVFYIFSQAEENLTITTYYPSPYGSYRELTTTGNTTLATSSGNVGIGTTSPTAKLEVNGTIRLPAATTEGRSITMGYGRTDSGYAYIDFIGDTTYSSYGLRIIRYNTGADAQSRIIHRGAGLLVIQTVDSGNIVLTGGNVGIGTTAPTHLLHLSGGAYCDGTTWVAGSDRAYKKDIDYNFKYGLKAVEQLKPVYYVHKDDKAGKRQIGFIAQDVKKVIPELVSGEEGSYGLNYGQFTSVLVSAIKEQQAIIESQEKRIKALEKRSKR